MKKISKNVTIVDHVLVQEALACLRDRNTPVTKFRVGLIDIGRLYAILLAPTFKATVTGITTPLGPAKGVEITDRDRMVLVAVLRAAIPLIEGFQRIFPEAKLGFISARRLEASQEDKGDSPQFPIEISYVNIPPIRENTVVIIGDPMLATGSTMLKILDNIKNHGKPRRLIVLSIVSTELGLNRVIQEHPDVEIYTAVIDPELNKYGYIIPGLGDAGQRAFIRPFED
ncbi:MAG: uracil phosphoribosyltransferase [Candidatus Hermodarchaeota archaeon]